MAGPTSQASEAGARAAPQSASRRSRRRFFGLAVAALSLPLLPAAAAEEADPPRSLLLVASNRITDSNFRRTVVLVTHHGGAGPIGLILNRPTDLALPDVFDGEPALRGRKDRLFLGGPVSRHTLVFLFRADTPPERAVQVIGGVFMSLDAEDSMRRLRDGATATQLRVFAGYSGWAPGQLEKEIAHGDWYLLPADAELILGSEPETLWETLIRRASQRAVRAGSPPGNPFTPQVRWQAADTRDT